MSNDLISRNAVIQTLKQSGIIVDNEKGHLIVEEIEKIPSAYDVDKVLEQLDNLFPFNTTIGMFVSKEDIVRIIRAGGVK